MHIYFFYIFFVQIIFKTFSKRHFRVNASINDAFKKWFGQIWTFQTLIFSSFLNISQGFIVPSSNSAFNTFSTVFMSQTEPSCESKCCFMFTLHFPECGGRKWNLFPSQITSNSEAAALPARPGAVGTNLVKWRSTKLCRNTGIQLLLEYIKY